MSLSSSAKNTVEQVPTNCSLHKRKFDTSYKTTRVTLNTWIHVSQTTYSYSLFEYAIQIEFFFIHNFHLLYITVIRICYLMLVHASSFANIELYIFRTILLQDSSVKCKKCGHGELNFKMENSKFKSSHLMKVILYRNYWICRRNRYC